MIAGETFFRGVETPVPRQHAHLHAVFMAGSYTISLRSIRASEYTLNVPRAATVGLLKARITETFPGSPAPDMQRLVFAGRLLSDASEPLEKVFAGWDDSLPLAVHLVIRSSVAPAPASPASAPAAVPIPQQNPGGWQQYPGNVGRFGPQAAMRPQMAQAAPQQAAAPRGHSFSLMLKLAFFVFILSQNSGYQRKLFFGAIAVVLYLYVLT